MITIDMQPISIVEDSGFKGLVNVLDKRYAVPSRRAVMTRLHKAYESTRSTVQKKLDSTEHVAITTDLWTSLQTISYCGVTAHYTSETWELTSTVLETFEFPAAHTGENSQRADEGHD